MPTPDSIYRVLMPTTAGGPAQEIRKFSDPGIQSSINNALAGLGSDSRGAVLQLEKNQTGYNAAIAAKINGRWSIALGYNKAEWGHAVGTSVKFNW